MTENGIFYGLIATTIALVALIYLPSLGYEYVYDDRLLFLANRALRSGWASLANIGMPIIQGTTYFRPVVMATFVAEFSLFDAVPVISKSFNLLVYLVNCALVALIARRLVRESMQVNASNRSATLSIALPICGMLFYGTHPSLIESVAWVSGRFDLVVTLFSLLAVWLAAKPTITTKRRVLICLCLLLALLSKEMAAALPLLVLLIRAALYYSTRETKLTIWFKSEYKLVAAMACTCFAYVLVRAWLHPQLISVDVSINEAASSVFAHLALVARTLLFYAKLTVYPYRDTNLLHPYSLGSLGDVSFENVIAVVFLCCVFVFALATIHLKKAWMWGLCALPVSLLPVLNIAPLRLGGSIGENRFLTLPLAFTVFAVALIVAHLANRQFVVSRLAQFAAASGAAMVLIFNTLFVRATLPIWRNDTALFASAFNQFPASDRAALFYLRAAIQAGDAATGIKLVELHRRPNEITIPLIPAFATALAIVGRKAESIALFDSALAGDAFKGLLDYEFEALLGYVGVLQAWGELDQAEKRLNQIRVIGDARQGAEDKYLVVMLELRQLILRGSNGFEYDNKMKELRAISTTESLSQAEKSLSQFKAKYCFDAKSKGIADSACGR